MEAQKVRINLYIMDRCNAVLASCDICNGEMIPCWNVREALAPCGGGWKYVCCRSCGLVRLHAEGSESTWRQFACEGDYYGDGFSKFAGAIQTLREFSAWRRAREINRLFSKPGRVLDIGCGEGLFLKWMKGMGWRVDGCEIGEQAVKRAEQCLGQRIHDGEFKNMSHSDHSWDVVMLWHVLEHVSNPVELLKYIGSVITTNGLLVVAVPNASSWQARLFGSHWFHLDPPRHRYSFGFDHLTRMARQSGWKVMESHHFSLEYNPFGWAQSFLNSLGWRRDAMYETLKRRSKPVEGAWALRVVAWLLLGPSIIPAILEAAVGKGGAVAVYLRKSGAQ